jgi:hypothetical protein
MKLKSSLYNNSNIGLFIVSITRKRVSYSQSVAICLNTVDTKPKRPIEVVYKVEGVNLSIEWRPDSIDSDSRVDSSDKRYSTQNKSKTIIGGIVSVKILFIV